MSQMSNQPGKSLPPGPELSAPESVQFELDQRHLLRSYRNRYGRDFTVHRPGRPPRVYISSAESLHDIFLRHAGDLGVLGPSLFAELVGTDSMAFIDGDLHRRERRLFVKALTQLDPAVTARKIAAVASRFVPPHNSSRPLSRIAEELTRECIIHVGLGELPESRHDEVVQALGTAMTRLRDHHLVALRGNTGDAEQAHQRCLAANARFRAVLEREISIAAADPVGTAVLPGMIRSARMPRSELLRHLITLLVAGHETTSVALARTLAAAAIHPEIIESVREEVRDISIPAGLLHAPLLRAFCSEVLRIEAVVPNGNTRKVIYGFDAAGYHYGRGTEICAFIHGRHQDYPHPDTFDPDRFLHGRPDTLHYLPFGIGHHACPGAALAMRELTVVLATFVVHALPEIENDTRDPTHEGVSIGPTVRLSENTALRMRSR